MCIYKNGAGFCGTGRCTGCGRCTGPCTEEMRQHLLLKTLCYAMLCDWILRDINCRTCTRRFTRAERHVPQQAPNAPHRSRDLMIIYLAIISMTLWLGTISTWVWHVRLGVYSSRSRYICPYVAIYCTESLNGLHSPSITLTPTHAQFPSSLGLLISSYLKIAITAS